MNRTLGLLIGATIALAPIIANATQHSRSAGSEAARNTSTTLPSDQSTHPGWRLVGGEAVWIFDSRSLSTRPADQSERTGESRAADRPQTQRVQGLNDIYHGA
jgi:hypothetical protein